MPIDSQPVDVNSSSVKLNGRESVPRMEAIQRSSHDAYLKDLRLFFAWGGTVPCDARTLERYIDAMRPKLAPPTLYRRAMSIRHAHISQDLPSPTDDPALRPVLRSIQRGEQVSKSSGRPRKSHQSRSAAPMTRRLLMSMLDYMHRSMKDRRDKALILLGFMAALKRAELTSLNVNDISFTEDAMAIRLSRGVKPRTVTIPITNGDLCAATAVKTWIDHAALDALPHGPLFCRFDRGGDPTPARLDSAYVSVIVKQRIEETGAQAGSYSAESLRKGRLLESARGLV